MSLVAPFFGTWCSFSRFSFIVRTDRQTESHAHTDADAAERLTHVTVVGVSKCDAPMTKTISGLLGGQHNSVTIEMTFR